MAVTDTEIQTLAESVEASTGVEGDSSSAQDILKDDSGVRDIAIIPPCVLHCLYPSALQNGCMYTDYLCFCAQMNAVLLEPGVQSCLQQCPFLGEQLYAQGSIMDFCESDGVQIEFPKFMSQYGVMHRRAFSSSAVLHLSVPASTTRLTTITSTLPWGYGAYTYTQPEGDDGTATVVFAAADTLASTTFLLTTTVPSGEAGYTSTLTDQKSAAITKVIGVTNGGSANTTPTSPAHPDSPGPTPTQSSSGLSSGAKIGIGIGVAVPLLLILLGLFIFRFWRRRKNVRVPPGQEPAQETTDGGLPEPMSTISELGYPKKHHPYFTGGSNDFHHVEAGGVPIHEMNATHQRYEAHGSPANTRHELTAEFPQQQAPLPMSPISTSAPTRKPVPSAQTVTTSFPPPWDSSGTAQYEQHRNVDVETNDAREDVELAQLEEQKRKQLQELQKLEAREEELKRSKMERKTIAGSQS